jgi:tryptophan synthase alpha chain
MSLHNPRMIGFGISNRETFCMACSNASGAIVGSRFVSLLGENGSPDAAIKKLLKDLFD